MIRRRRITFAIPLTAATYAPEELYLSLTGAAEALDFVNEYEGLVESLPTDADLVIEVLRLDGDPTEDADWFVLETIGSVGMTSIDPHLGWHLRVRGKSGGTAGDSVLSMAWQTA